MVRQVHPLPVIARRRPGAVEDDLVRRERMRCDTDTLETRPLSDEHAFAYWQQDIPQEYWDLSGPELVERVRLARQKLGSRLIVLGLSEQLISIILGAKNDKIPNTLANAILLHMKNGTASSKAGLTVLLEAAVLLDAEKTAALGDLANKLSPTNA